MQIASLIVAIIDTVLAGIGVALAFAARAKGPGKHRK